MRDGMKEKENELTKILKRRELRIRGGRGRKFKPPKNLQNNNNIE